MVPFVQLPHSKARPKNTLTNEDFPGASAIAASGLTSFLALGSRSYLLAVEGFPAHKLFLARVQCHHRQNEGDRAGHVSHDRPILPNIIPGSTLRTSSRDRGKHGGAA